MRTAFHAVWSFRYYTAPIAVWAVGAALMWQRHIGAAVFFYAVATALLWLADFFADAEGLL